MRKYSKSQAFKKLLENEIKKWATDFWATMWWRGQTCKGCWRVCVRSWKRWIPLFCQVVPEGSLKSFGRMWKLCDPNCHCQQHCPSDTRDPKQSLHSFITHNFSAAFPLSVVLAPTQLPSQPAMDFGVLSLPSSICTVGGLSANTVTESAGHGLRGLKSALQHLHCRRS